MIEQIGNIIIECLVSACSIVGIVKFTADKIANMLFAKCEVKLQGELEKKKTLNERKNYISKAKFDKEFELYQDLSEKQITLVYDIGESVMVARGMYKDEADEVKRFMERFTEDINNAEISLKRYGCFISKEIYEQYKRLDKMGSDIYKLSLFLYNLRFVYSQKETFKFKEKIYDEDTAAEEIERLQKTVSGLSDEIIDQIREYLNALDVI